MPAGRIGSKGRTCCRSGRWTEAGRRKNRLRLQAFRAAPPVITRFASMSPASRPLVLWHASSRPPEQPRRDAELFFAGADRTADGLQAADGLAVSIRIDLQHRLRLRLRARVERGRPGGKRGSPTPQVRYLPLSTTIDRRQGTPKPRAEGSNPSAPAKFLLLGAVIGFLDGCDQNNQFALWVA